MLQDIRAFLLQPYPDRDDLRSILKLGLYTGILIFFILYFFRPFGMSDADDVLEITIIFGIITAVTSVGYDFLMVYVLRINREHPTWTFIKWLWYVVGLMFCIAMANYFFLVLFVLEQPFHWMGLFIMIRGVLLVGVIPTTLFGGLKMIRLLKQNQELASSIQANTTVYSPVALVNIPILKSKSTWSIDPNQIYFVEAQQNYVAIMYESDGSIKKEILRNTISNVANALVDTTVIRCHRSFLVNNAKVQDISGNAQGLKLHLGDMDGQTVPVSRKYIPIFKN